MLHEEKELSAQLSEKFRDFLVQHSPSTFSRRLRHILLEYIVSRHRIGFPVSFNASLLSLSDFFELLDAASDEFDPGHEEREETAE